MYLFLPFIIALGVILYYVQRTPLDPDPMVLGDPPDLSSVLYNRAELITKYDLDRPEDILIFEEASETFFLTGIGTGRLVKVNMNTGESEDLLTPFDFKKSPFTDTQEKMEEYCNGGMYREAHCGRILGLNFRENDKSKVLIVNAYFGIYEYDLTNQALKLLVETPGSFINSIVELNGYIYYTVSHHTFMRYQFIYVALDGAKGSVYRINPDLESSEIEPEVIMDGLIFPNGIISSEDGKYLIIAETTQRSILKYDLETGEKTTFISNLPFYPDNIHVDYTRNKIYTCGLRRNKLGEEWMFPYPEVIKWLTRSPKFVHIPILLYFILDNDGVGAEIDLIDGTVTKLIDPNDSEIFPFCSTLRRLEGDDVEGEEVYIAGSVLFDYASKFKVSKREESE